ncbi:hypothetical protein L0F81_22240 [Streptomyces tricolor]|uniref:Secreted protein n=1 Tax=Streptomyces tricolor TaxID=68277 RepID=A0ABS9JK90_9ACTN|nr:hypothetical protein [Streptomyces tricolor]MCG0065982.1 hypothetical protein [Streptomyces tricolor]
MRHRLITAAVSVLVLAVVGSGAPAHADATVHEGKVGLSVKGQGLRVQRAGAWMDGHGRGVRARLYTVYEGTRTDLTRWQDATPRSVGISRFSDVGWKLNRRFRHGTWLCVEFNRADGAPCARIHR